MSLVQGDRPVVTLPPFDAWAVIDGEAEPMGSHTTLDAALRGLDATGGAVTAGMTFLRWHPATGDDAKGVLRDALVAHGTRAPKEGS